MLATVVVEWAGTRVDTCVLLTSVLNGMGDRLNIANCNGIDTSLSLGKEEQGNRLQTGSVDQIHSVCSQMQSFKPY